MRRVILSPGTTLSVPLTSDANLPDVSFPPIPLDSSVHIWRVRASISAGDTSGKLQLISLFISLAYMLGDGATTIGSLRLPSDIGWGTSGPVAFPLSTANVFGCSVLEGGHGLMVSNMDNLQGFTPGGSPGAFRLTANAFLRNTDGAGAHSATLSVAAVIEAV